VPTNNVFRAERRKIRLLWRQRDGLRAFAKRRGEFRVIRILRGEKEKEEGGAVRRLSPSSRRLRCILREKEEKKREGVSEEQDLISFLLCGRKGKGRKKEEPADGAGSARPFRCVGRRKGGENACGNLLSFGRGKGEKKEKGLMRFRKVWASVSKLKKKKKEGSTAEIFSCPLIYTQEGRKGDPAWPGSIPGNVVFLRYPKVGKKKRGGGAGWRLPHDRIRSGVWGKKGGKKRQERGRGALPYLPPLYLEGKGGGEKGGTDFVFLHS